MKLGATTAVIGSLEQQRRLDVIANNVANSSSPGYKKDNVCFNTVLGQVTYTSLDQGPLKETGNKLDIALSGKGFLRAQSDRGVLYTRAGNLRLDTGKNLVTQDGWPVLGKNGPISVENTSNLRIEENGQVFDGINQLDTLDIVHFPPEAGLKKVQGGYFEPSVAGIQPVKSEECTVRQGALEGPNFNPVDEMVHLVETVRNFEAFQKTMQIFDKDLDAQLISKLSG